MHSLHKAINQRVSLMTTKAFIGVTLYPGVWVGIGMKKPLGLGAVVEVGLG